MRFGVKSGLLALPLVALGFQLATGVVFAQNASLNGTVTDPQGGVVPGSSVTLTNVATGSQRSIVTDDEGRYVFPQIAPGNYDLKASLDGFKTSVIRGVVLAVDTATTVDLRLELGQVNEVVTVASTSEALLNQVDATIGNTFNEKQIVELPLNTRNVFSLLSLQPGVTRDGEAAGARRDQSNLTLDGVDVNEQQQGGFFDENGNLDAFQPVLRVTPDSVQEFRVTVSNPTSNQGRSAGAQVSLVTKGGTNQWAGTLYEFHRNTVTTANDFFNNRVVRDGCTPGAGVDCAIPRPALIRNLFGGSVGGPIVKDKAFFFFNYEGRRDRSQQSVVRTVPLAHLGRGEVRYENTSQEIVTLNTDQLNAIYPVGINPVAVQVLAAAAAAFPANDNSEGDGLNTGGFRFNASTPLDENTYIAKVDLNLNDANTLYLRGNYQWDLQGRAPEFPGTTQPSTWSHPVGFAVGDTWTVTPRLINTFRYGLTRQAFTNLGDSAENDISFRFVFSPLGFTRTLARTTPVHNFVNDTSWISGNHTIQFGTNIRLIDNGRRSFSNSYDDAITNPSFYDFSGAVVSDPIEDLASSSASVYENAATALIGRYSEYSGNFLFGADGSLENIGTPSTRTFATEEYEFYVEDTWQVSSGLTLNLGLRYSLNTPVNETTGFQVAPTIGLGDYFNSRVRSSEAGTPFNDLITVDVAGPFYDRDGYYPLDKNNFAPRLSFAWTPKFDGGVLGSLFGKDGQSVIRGGFAMSYDRVGSALAVSFDLNNTLGFSSSQTISANTFNVTDRPGPLFTGFGQDIRGLFENIPSSIAFPLMQEADEEQRIERSLDNTITTPVNYNWNFSIGREFGKGFYLEGSYIGRVARDLLATRDVMALNNLVDPQSGMDWYTAAGLLAQYRLSDTPIDQVPAIPYFENLWSGFQRTRNGLPRSFTDRDGNVVTPQNPTQFIYSYVSRDGSDILDWTFVQLLIDDAGIFPNAFFHPQYAALSTFSTVASSDYHAFALSARERFGDSLTLDFNYTLAKSIDLASTLQTSGAYASILNPLRPRDSRGLSDFDVRHIINANWLWNLPVGRGRSFGSGMTGVTDALLGGWAFNGIFRWNSGLPVDPPFDRAQWATNWNVQSNGTAIVPIEAVSRKGGDSPNFFEDQTTAYQSFRNALPGETGQRNTLRESGYVSLDFGLFKSFRMPYNEGHSIQFRWEVFNAFNNQTLAGPVITRSTYGLGQDPQADEPPPNFGNITSIKGDPRVMQFGLKYIF